MSERVQPALSAKEWTSFGSDDFRALHDSLVNDTRFHGIAALALHGQSFGFTWEEDVAGLRAIAESLDPKHLPEDVQDIPRRFLLGLADRIAALLPPREKE